MAVRTMTRNDFNFATDPGSGAAVVVAIVAAAQRRDHLRDGINMFAWRRDEDGNVTVLVTTDDKGQATHLANSLGLPSGHGKTAFLLPRQGTVSGVNVVIDVKQGDTSE